jgi:metallo-beta-lactamase class B
MEQGTERERTLMSCGMGKRLLASFLLGISVVAAAGQRTTSCSQCSEWNKAQAPFRIFGNTYYVGPHGLSSVLITSAAGHILIDGDLPESARLIADNIRSLGFRLEDVKVIVNSHVHSDHAGGIAELQRRTGARVVASEWSAEVLRKGGVGKGDPQFGVLMPVAAVKNVTTFREGESLHLGDILLSPHLTAGHTPGGTSWTWKACEGTTCYAMVYADSLNPVSAPEFRFKNSSAYPNAVEDFEKSFTFFEAVPCDVLITAHPEASNLWERVTLREKGVKPDPMVDSGACRTLAASGREKLRQRLAGEGKTVRNGRDVMTPSGSR